MLRVSVTALVLAASAVVPSATPSVAADRPHRCTPKVTAITVPSHLYAGDRSTGRLTLSCAPRKKAKVALRSDRTAMEVPASVTVPAGRRTATVPVRATTASGPEYVARITATYRGRSVRDTTTVTPGLKLVEIPLSSAANDVGLSVLFTGTVPDEGVTVRLASDNAAVKVPRTVTFTQGLGGDVSGIEVQPVSKDTKVTISATLGTRTLRDSTTLLGPFTGTQPVSFGLSEPGDLYGGMWFEQVDLALSRPAPAGGLTVDFSVRDADPAVQLETPTTEFISEGDRTAYMYLDTTAVTQTVHVVLEARITGAGIDRTVPLSLVVQPAIESVTLPDTAPAGAPFTGTVSLAGPADEDSVIWLEANWGILEVPTSVTIPAGATSATFEGRVESVSEPSLVGVTAYLGRTNVSSNSVEITP